MSSPATPVWVDPDFAQLLADAPELVAIADAVQQTRAARPARRRRSFSVRFGLAVVIVVVAAAVVLAAPWSRGSQAAVLERIRSALSPRPGWILHERYVIRQVEVNGGNPVTTVSEVWIRFARPYAFRELIRRSSARPLEAGGTVQPRRAFVFDSATDKLYADAGLVRGASVPRDPATQLRRAVTAGNAAIAGRVTIDGRSLYRVVPTTPQRYGGPWVDYVDATTFRPVRFESSGLPVRGPHGVEQPSTSVVTVVAYEYLPPTPFNVRLANIRTRHPDAVVMAAAVMPVRLRNEVTPP